MHDTTLSAAAGIAYYGRYWRPKLCREVIVKIHWLIIGVVLIFVFLTPLMNALMNWIRPLTPEQQEARRLAEEHRRKINLR